MTSSRITEMVKNMGAVAITVVIILLIMSVYSIAIMVERYLTYTAAKKQSREFAPARGPGARRTIASKKRSISATSIASRTWRWWSTAGCRSFAPTNSQAIFRATRSKPPSALCSERLPLRPPNSGAALSGLATIGSTAPFVGLFGTVFGIINAFRGMKNAESAGIAAVAGGISEALFTTALGLVVAVPAVWLFNYFHRQG